MLLLLLGRTPLTLILCKFFTAYFCFPCKGFWSACLQVVLVGAIIRSYFTFFCLHIFSANFLVHIFSAYYQCIFPCKEFLSGCLQVVLVGAIIGSYFTLSIMAAPASSSSSWKEDASKNLHKYNFQFWRNTVSNFDRSIIFHSCPLYLILLQVAGVHVISGKIIEQGSTEDKIQDPKFRRFTDLSDRQI